MDFERWLEENEGSVGCIDSVGTIDGVEIYRDFYSEYHSEDIEETVTFVGFNKTFRRRGRKEISYEQWVDNIWYEWEEV